MEFIPVLMIMGIGLGGLVLWIWTLIDCITNESTEGNERIVWVVVIAITHWIGALMAAGGLYLLSVKAGFEISPYDLVVLAGAFVWAGHVHLVDRYGGLVGPLRLSIGQFVVCGALSIIAAIFFEEVNLASLSDGLYPILYGAFLSVGLAYPLQGVAQRTADPSHAVIILSLEGAFAALGGWIVLQEVLTPRDLLGSGLMLAGVLCSQIFGKPMKGK